MGARALNEIDRTIAETLQHVEVQRNVVQKYNDGGQITDAALAAGILRALGIADGVPVDTNMIDIFAPGGACGRAQGQ